ncbi:MAG: hypothetical protein R6U39_05290 [Candidatus Aegiribacteria sp.]
MDEILFINSRPEDSGRWEPSPESPLQARSMSVFGTLGSRYSLLVMEKGMLTGKLAGPEGCWYLADSWRDGTPVRFDLQWVVDAGGSGCVVLCGRENPSVFHTSA